MKALFVRLLRNFSIAFVICLASLLLLEFLIRVALPVYNPSGRIVFTSKDGVPLAEPGFVGRQWKNTGDYDVEVRINELGLRDTRDIRQATPADIIVVGDSFSFGHGVEEHQRYSNQLDQLIDEPVYNLAIPTDLIGYRRLFDHAVSQGARPGRIVIGICMENDILEYDRVRRIMRDPQTVARHSSLLRSAKQLLTAHSAVYNAFTSIIHQIPAMKQLATSLGLVRENEAALSGKSISREQALSTVRELSELRSALAVNDLWLLVIPARTLWLGSRQAEERASHISFVEALNASGFQVIDLLPVFEKNGEPLALHFVNDGHWNAAGHRVAAEALAAVIERRRPD